MAMQVIVTLQTLECYVQTATVKRLRLEQETGYLHASGNEEVVSSNLTVGSSFSRSFLAGNPEEGF